MILKRMFLVILFMALAVVQGAFPSQNIKIKTLDYSNRDLRDNQDNPQVKFKSQGLATAAMGQWVYLGVETGGLDIRKYQWSLEGPENNGARLSDSAIANPIFIPGKVGQYDIKLTAVDAKGVSYTSDYWITAANFVGNGAVVDMNNKAQCIHCHQDKVNSWKTTPHAEAFRRGIEGKLSVGYYRIYCFSCHRNGYDKADIWAAMEKKEHWHIQEELKERGLESWKQDLPQVANLVSVQCESCHGPGSEHVGQIDKNRISKSTSPGVCAICHDTRDSNSKPGQCAHSPQVAGQTCVACHDPHDSHGSNAMLKAGTKK